MPRRGPLFGLAVGAALGLILLGLVVRRDGTPAPTVAGVPQDRPGPVLLVPGYGGATGALEVLAAKLRAAGRDASVVALPGDGTGDLREAARALDVAATAAITAGAPSVDVIGYSAGGVTARYWAKELGGATKARRVITLGSPHHGSKVARLALRFAGGSCPVACRQLVPGSDLLEALNADDETPDGPEWLALWTAQDGTVTPPDSARLEGAVDVVLQDVCADAVISHADLPRTALVGGIVLAALDTGPIPTPVSADCVFLQQQGR